MQPNTQSPNESGDLITLRATSTFWYAPENRHVSIGDQIVILRSDFPKYGAVCKELVSGSLEAPKPVPKEAGFASKMIEKAAEILTPKSGSIVCEHCGKSFKEAKGLEIHMKNAHKDLK